MADFNAFGLVERQEMIDFSQGISVWRPNLGTRLFPDRKTQYINEEYERMMQNGHLPDMAQVHAFDTEANIAERLTWDKVRTEQLLIKRKINQTETLRKRQRQLNDSEIKTFVFDDASRLVDSVIARVEKAKIDALTLGKYVIKENNLDITIDYQVPEENRVKTWWDEDANILADLVKWTDMAREHGSVDNTGITTMKVFRKIQANKSVQQALFGSTNVGILPTLEQINTLFQAQAGITLIIADENETYGERVYDGTKLTIKQVEFFPADTFVLCRLVNGTLGAGLWGVTPEEEAQNGTFNTMSERQFITVTQWTAEDPVAVWTKASALFAPVLPDVYGHIIANIADVSSKPEAVLTGVKLPLSVENGGTGAATADNARTNLDVYSKSEVDGKVAG